MAGGPGFIGSHVVDRLLDEGYEATAADDLSEGGTWRTSPTWRRISASGS